MECLGDLRDGLFGVFELVDEGADKRGADVLVGGFLRRAFDDPVQILRRHAQLRSVPPDGVLMADASQEQPYKLLEQHVFATDARQLAVFVFLPDVLVGNVHHEHPEGALQHFGTETMRIVIKNLHNALDSFLKNPHSLRRYDRDRQHFDFQHIGRRKRRRVLEQRSDERSREKHHESSGIGRNVKHFEQRIVQEIGKAAACERIAPVPPPHFQFASEHKGVDNHVGIRHFQTDGRAIGASVGLPKHEAVRQRVAATVALRKIHEIHSSTRFN